MKIGIVGLGLMGASFGRTVLKNTEALVYGYDISQSVMLKAGLLNAISAPLDDKNVKEIDLLVISVFERDFCSVAKKYLPHLKDGAIVMDFCGIKRPIVECMKKLKEEYPQITFIGGHPMAGREYSGIDHSITTLFNKASMILTPVQDDIFVEDWLKKFFLSLGFEKVVITDAENHDKNIAFTSQLCHIVSNAFIKSPTAEDHVGFSAGSYKDLTRVAKMNPDMWTELVLDNGDFALKELDILIENLLKYRKAIADKDQQLIRQLFAEGNQIKLKIDSGKNK